MYLYEKLQRMAREPGFKGIKDEVCIVVDRTNGKPSNFDVEVSRSKNWLVTQEWLVLTPPPPPHTPSS